MIQFYAPDILTSLRLPTDESAHCIRVLRKRVGDKIMVSDGKGHRYTCIITEANSKSTLVDIESSAEIIKQWRGELTLAFAPVKNNERTEWMLEKAVEIGVDRIVPILCEHSERKVLKTDRMHRIIKSAFNQSLKTTIPELSELTPLTQFVNAQLPPQRIVGYCADDIDRTILSEVLKPDIDTVICIGPEGDFSPAEVKQLFSAGFIPTTFGESRMRAETAALFAVSAYHLINMK